MIIPVYNAADFVTQAVQSALDQPETAEVILVEDGSPDDSLEVCQELAAKYNKVRLFRHPGGANRGAGASRNLGMKNSSCEYIAFLDADDFYLPGRFTVAKKIFDGDPTCEGVYEAAGMHVEDEEGYRRWQDAKKSENRLQTITRRLTPEALPRALLTGDSGYFILDAFVIKRSVLEKSGYMIETLRLHQDTHFIIKVACVARLLPGRLDEPVSMWRVHEHNRISAPRSDEQKYRDRMLFWKALYRWLKGKGIRDFQQMTMNHMVLHTIGEARFNKALSRLFPKAVLRLSQLVQWLLRDPGIIFEPPFWESLKNIRRLSFQ